MGALVFRLPSPVLGGDVLRLGDKLRSFLFARFAFASSLASSSSSFLCIARSKASVSLVVTRTCPCSSSFFSSSDSECSYDELICSFLVFVPFFLPSCSWHALRWTPSRFRWTLSCCPLAATRDSWRSRSRARSGILRMPCFCIAPLSFFCDDSLSHRPLIFDEWVGDSLVHLRFFLEVAPLLRCGLFACFANRSRAR